MRVDVIIETLSKTQIEEKFSTLTKKERRQECQVTAKRMREHRIEDRCKKEGEGEGEGEEVMMKMQMSYRTEAYRISITSSRNSADRNVAVALTCTLLCY
jgi:uncharacterized protein YndB with AHSA1/START domain